MIFDAGLRAYEQAYLQEIRDALAEPVPETTREAAVEYARNLMSRGLPVLFDRTHVAFVTGVDSQTIGLIRTFPGRFYARFRVRKHGGGSRLIASPTPALKQVQHWIHTRLTSRLWTHPSVHGFVRGRSIATNAEPHLQASLIVKLDIRDFFGSVDRDRVFRAFRRVGYTREVSDLLTDLTTLDGALPQGAPTSPDLANHVAYGLDVRLGALADSNALAYTRYADDLTFSGERLRSPQLRRLIEHIIRDEGFAPHEDKVRFLEPSGRQAVTGVVVNKRLNVPRPTRRWLRQESYYLRRYGIEEHLDRRGIDRAHYKEFIYGHVYALNVVRPDEARKLLRELDQVDWPY